MTLDHKSIARRALPLDQWTVVPATPGAAPVPAAVPGAVQLDWAAAQGWPAFWQGQSSTQYAWMEDVRWTYHTAWPAVELSTDQRLFLVLEGVDYQCDVALNGKTIATHEGMFSPIELDVTRFAGGAAVEIRLYPAPKRPDAPPDRAQADTAVKPAVSYGWDWHPRLIPLGIWQPVRLEVRPVAHVRSFEVAAELSADCGSAVLHCRLDVAGNAPRRWTVRDPAGAVVHQGDGQPFTIDRPQLWWPHDHGDQPLYTATLQLLDDAGGVIDQATHRFGIRRVELVMAPGQWREPGGFPKSRSHPPITLRINGRDLFAKGSNWVNPDVFPGRITPDDYRVLLKLAKDANFNLLRIWGGGIVNKESFFDLCDELGILIWQEFPLACNDYDHRKRPAYLAVLEQEARAIVRRLRRHPCLAMWCGGNELFNYWSGMTDQSLALRLLGKICYEEDRDTPFIPTSPLDGMAHGHYLFHDPQMGEVHQVMQRSGNTAYTEFGVSSVSPVEYLKTFIPVDELWPPMPGGSWEHHHAFNAWRPETWLCAETVERYFGKSDTLEQFVDRSQWLQAEGYKAAFEEARRQKPRCSMALNWCFNEPWPTAGNNSIVNWPARPKPSYAAVRAACRPVMASARIRRFAWKAGDAFQPEIWLLNDTYTPVDVGELRVRMILDGPPIDLLTWRPPPLEPNTHLRGPTLHTILPDSSAEAFTLELLIAGSPDRSSRYRLRYLHAESPHHRAASPMMNQ